MKSMSVAGIVLIVLGVGALAYQGITYTSRETVIDIGPLHATADRQKTIPLPPIVGGLAVAEASRCSSSAGGKADQGSGSFQVSGVRYQDGRSSARVARRHTRRSRVWSERLAACATRDETIGRVPYTQGTQTARRMPSPDSARFSGRE